MPAVIKNPVSLIPPAEGLKTKNGKATCLHCGTGFRRTAHRPDFCCAGCQFVHDLITKNGLGQFYDLQEEGVQPVKSLVFQKRDYTWLEELVVTAEREPIASLQLDLQGLSCIGCVWLIEKVFARKSGGLSVRVDPTLGQIGIRWQSGEFDLITFARELQSFGYLVGPLGKSASAVSSGLVKRLGICAALTMNTMLFTLPSYLGMAQDFQFAALFNRLSLILGTLSLLVGGSYFFIRSWRSLRQGVLHIDLPISIGLIAAYAGSVYAWSKGAHGFVYFDFVSTFTFLMLVGRWLQQKAVERNRAQLLAAQADPPPVRRLDSGERMPVAELAPGIAFAVEPGQLVPVRSRLLSDGATLGMEWINGESEAAVAQKGRLIPAGAANCGQSAVECEALEVWSESLLSKLLRVAPEGSERNYELERFIRGYIYIVLSVAAAGFATWWTKTGDLLTSLQVLISVLVVSCPCASGVALPLASDLAASRLRQVGVFVRKSDLWQRLDRVRKIIFDKTGTLTLETISLRNPDALAALDDDSRAVLLAMVLNNLHPVSGCLREQLMADGVDVAPAPEAKEYVGLGLEVQHGGAAWRLGRPGWSGEAQGDCLFSRNGEVLAAFSFGEEARSDAGEEISSLGARNCRVFILSGDRNSKVEAMADRLELPREQCHGEMSPEQKAEWLAHLDKEDTLFIGDGANDSLAFDEAWCTGTPAVDRGLLEQKADFYFLGRGLNGVRALLDMAVRRRRTARGVVGFAIGYNVVAVALCLSGHMSPLLAAVLMPASSLVSLGIVFTGLRKRSA
ncbi:heavy metal translocating P-type ATPase metal-binding domain-containing protein [Verrucomicrobiota bacterium sgz303538]